MHTATNIITQHNKKNHHLPFSFVIPLIHILTVSKILYVKYPIQYIHVTVNKIYIKNLMNFGIPLSLTNLYIFVTSTSIIPNQKKKSKNLVLTSSLAICQFSERLYYVLLHYIRLLCLLSIWN